MAAVTPVALDHNFPQPLRGGVARWMPEFAFHWIKGLPPGNSTSSRTTTSSTSYTVVPSP